MTDLRERGRAVRQAQDALSKAIGSLALPAYVDDAAIAQSIFFSALALVRLAEADGDAERARKIVVDALGAEIERRKAETPP